MKILAGIGIALSVLANVVGVLGFFGFGPLRILEFASGRRAKSVEIAWPSGREPIPRCIEVRGTSTPLPSGEALWASVYTESATENQNVYYLGSRAEYDRNRVRLWSASNVVVGTKDEGGRSFTIVMLHTKGDATGRFEAIIKGPGAHDIGNKLPPGATATASLTVQRSSLDNCGR